MRRSTFSLALFALLLTACASATPTPTPTPQPSPTAQPDNTGALVVQMLQQQIGMQATQQVLDQQRINNEARLTATQLAQIATSTEQARLDGIARLNAGATSTQQVWEVTRQAAVAQATSTAAAEATKGSIEATRSAAAWNAQATAQAAQAENTVIELNKTRMTYGITAWGPWVLLFLVGGAFVFYIWKKSQVGIVQTDSSGRYPVMVIQDGKRKTVLMPDRLPVPLLELHDGTSAPQLTDTESQRLATRGAQVVEAVKSLPPGYPRQAIGMAGSLAANPSAQVNIQVVQPDRLGPVLDEVEGGLLEGD